MATPCACQYFLDTPQEDVAVGAPLAVHLQMELEPLTGDQGSDLHGTILWHMDMAGSCEYKVGMNT